MKGLDCLGLFVLSVDLTGEPEMHPMQARSVSGSGMTFMNGCSRLVSKYSAGFVEDVFATGELCVNCNVCSQNKLN